jgi:hypothetical protein
MQYFSQVRGRHVSAYRSHEPPDRILQGLGGPAKRRLTTRKAEEEEAEAADGCDVWPHRDLRGNAMKHLKLFNVARHASLYDGATQP